MTEYLQILLSLITGDSFLFRSLVIAFAITFALTPPEKGRKGGVDYLLALLGTTVVMLLVGNLLNVVVLKIGLPPFLFILGDFARSILVTVVYTALFCRYPTKTKWIMAGSTLAAICVCVDLSFTLGQVVSGHRALQLVFLLLCYGIMAGFAVFQVHRSIVTFVDFPQAGGILIMTTDLIIIALTLITQLMDTIVLAVGIYSVIIYCVLFLLDFVTYFSVYNVCMERSEIYDLKMENQMVRASYEQVEISRANLAELRKMRHDLKNAHAYMSVLLEKQRYAELAKALASLSPQTLNPEFYVDCGNSEVSAILTCEASKAHLRGIRLKSTIVVPPVIPIEGSEFCSLLSNLIDNAIESNVRYGITEDITVQMNLRGEYLYICVVNTLPEGVNREELLTLNTTKENPEEHGMGTQIVKRIAEKYNGHFLADIERNRFIAEVLIDMMVEVEKE